MKKRMNYNVIKPLKGAGGQAGFLCAAISNWATRDPLFSIVRKRHYDNDRAIVRFERSRLIAR
jgi:hypothetical protein